MATLSYPRALDTAELATRIKGWFDLRSFETSMVGGGSGYTIKAWKSSWFRTVMAADRALEVIVCTWAGGTQVVVSQGDWTTNLVSNWVWATFTGGTNVAISGWSFVIQWQLEAYIRQTMEELAGKRELIGA